MGDEYRIKHYFDIYGPIDNWTEAGFTIVVNMTRQLIGISICSDKDQFCKKTGVAIAKERIQQLINAEPPDIEELSIVGIMAPAMMTPKKRRWLADALDEAMSVALRAFPDAQSIMIVMDPTKEHQKEEKVEEVVELTEEQLALDLGQPEHWR